MRVKERLESDQELIQACRLGDVHAWEKVLDRYERLVYSIALRFGLSGEDAADVTQITFTILMQSLDSLKEGTQLASWLSTVARRHTWRLLERQRREKVGPDGDVAESELLGGEANSVERWERLEWLTYGLSMLNLRCRELLLALYFDPARPSYAQVAERFGMPLGSVGPTRARCLEQLRQFL